MGNMCEKCFSKGGKPKCKKYLTSAGRVSKCAKLQKLSDLYESALIPQNSWGFIDYVDKAPIDKDELINDAQSIKDLKNIADNMRKYVDNGLNLYIYSEKSGNGKTSWSLRLIQEYLDSIWHEADLGCHALFISVPRFLLALKDSISKENPYAEHIINNVLNAKLVVWDDIATKSATDFERENLFSMIDTRIMEGKANIFTSNVDVSTDVTNTKKMGEINGLMGTRLASRIVNCSKNIKLTGNDKRGLNKEVIK